MTSVGQPELVHTVYMEKSKRTLLGKRRDNTCKQEGGYNPLPSSELKKFVDLFTLLAKIDRRIKSKESVCKNK